MRHLGFALFFFLLGFLTAKSLTPNEKKNPSDSPKTLTAPKPVDPPVPKKLPETKENPSPKKTSVTTPHPALSWNSHVKQDAIQAMDYDIQEMGFEIPQTPSDFKNFIKCTERDGRFGLFFDLIGERTLLYEHETGRYIYHFDDRIVEENTPRERNFRSASIRRDLNIRYDFWANQDAIRSDHTAKLSVVEEGEEPFSQRVWTFDCR